MTDMEDQTYRDFRSIKNLGIVNNTQLENDLVNIEKMYISDDLKMINNNHNNNNSNSSNSHNNNNNNNRIKNINTIADTNSNSINSNSSNTNSTKSIDSNININSNRSHNIHNLSLSFNNNINSNNSVNIKNSTFLKPSPIVTTSFGIGKSKRNSFGLHTPDEISNRASLTTSSDFDTSSHSSIFDNDNQSLINSFETFQISNSNSNHNNTISNNIVNQKSKILPSNSIFNNINNKSSLPTPASSIIELSTHSVNIPTVRNSSLQNKLSSILPIRPTTAPVPNNNNNTNNNNGIFSSGVNSVATPSQTLPSAFKHNNGVRSATTSSSIVLGSTQSFADNKSNHHDNDYAFEFNSILTSLPTDNNSLNGFNDSIDYSLFTESNALDQYQMFSNPRISSSTTSSSTSALVNKSNSTTHSNYGHNKSSSFGMNKSKIDPYYTQDRALFDYDYSPFNEYKELDVNVGEFSMEDQLVGHNLDQQQRQQHQINHHNQLQDQDYMRYLQQEYDQTNIHDYLNDSSIISNNYQNLLNNSQNKYQNLGMNHHSMMHKISNNNHSHHNHNNNHGHHSHNHNHHGHNHHGHHSNNHSHNNDNLLMNPHKADIGKIFIGGLNWETTDESMRKYFEKYGLIDNCVVMKDTSTGRSRGFGFITFKFLESVERVMNEEHTLDGKVIDPKRAIPRDEQDKTEKIFVGGVPPDITETEFRDFFTQFGKVVDATLMMDRETGRPRGFGFITFESVLGVEKAMDKQTAGELILMDKSIEIKHAMPKSKLANQQQPGNNNSNNNGNGNGNSQQQNQKQVTNNRISRGSISSTKSSEFNSSVIYGINTNKNTNSNNSITSPSTVSGISPYSNHISNNNMDTVNHHEVNNLLIGNNNFKSIQQPLIFQDSLNKQNFNNTNNSSKINNKYQNRQKIININDNNNNNNNNNDQQYLEESFFKNYSIYNDMKPPSHIQNPSPKINNNKNERNLNEYFIQSSLINEFDEFNLSNKKDRK